MGWIHDLIEQLINFAHPLQNSPVPEGQTMRNPMSGYPAGSPPQPSPGPSTTPTPQTPITMPPTQTSTPAHVSAFLKQFFPMALQVEKQFGIPALVTLSHAANESGWGQSQMAKRKNNFFGMNAVDQNPNFADKYNSPQDSFNQYGRLLSTNPRYKQAMDNKSNPESMIQSIFSSGYASDSNAAKNVIDISKTISPELDKLRQQSTNTIGHLYDPTSKSFQPVYKGGYA